MINIRSAIIIWGVIKFNLYLCIVNSVRVHIHMILNDLQSWKTMPLRYVVYKDIYIFFNLSVSNWIGMLLTWRWIWIFFELKVSNSSPLSLNLHLSKWMEPLVLYIVAVAMAMAISFWMEWNWESLKIWQGERLEWDNDVLSVHGRLRPCLDRGKIREERKLWRKIILFSTPSCLDEGKIERGKYWME